MPLRETWESDGNQGWKDGDIDIESAPILTDISIGICS